MLPHASICCTLLHLSEQVKCRGQIFSQFTLCCVLMRDERFTFTTPLTNHFWLKSCSQPSSDRAILLHLTQKRWECSTTHMTFSQWWSCDSCFLLIYCSATVELPTLCTYMGAVHLVSQGTSSWVKVGRCWRDLMRWRTAACRHSCLTLSDGSCLSTTGASAGMERATSVWRTCWVASSSRSSWTAKWASGMQEHHSVCFICFYRTVENSDHTSLRSVRDAVLYLTLYILLRTAVQVCVLWLKLWSEVLHLFCAVW